nr:unnamed protein product [Digitaria exilis]
MGPQRARGGIDLEDAAGGEVSVEERGKRSGRGGGRGDAREEEREEGDGDGEVEPEGEGGGEREGAGWRRRPRRGCVGRGAFVGRPVGGGAGIGRRHCWMRLLAGAAWGMGLGSVECRVGGSGKN